MQKMSKRKTKKQPGAVLGPLELLKSPADAAQEITALHGEIECAGRMTIEKAIRIGELLSQAKATLQHGQWLPWVKGLPFTDQTARRYMQCYGKRGKFNNMLNLTAAYRLLAAATEPNAKDGEKQAEEKEFDEPGETLRLCEAIKKLVLRWPEPKRQGAAHWILLTLANELRLKVTPK